jgi:predicted nuclease with TOPRIM domain
VDLRRDYIQTEADHKAIQDEIRSKEKKRRKLMDDPVRNNARIIQLDGEIANLEEDLQELTSTLRFSKNVFKAMSKNLDDLEAKIFYTHHVKKQSLRTIAKNLHYSYSHIKRLSAQIRRKVGM